MLRFSEAIGNVNTKMKRQTVILLIMFRLVEVHKVCVQDLLCKVNCASAQEKSVCGTDGVTYLSRWVAMS